MMRSGFIRSLAALVAFVLVAALLVWPVVMQADQAQYFYDELGRLVAVVDGQGNTAVYIYDAVGNLLAIQRFTSTGGGSTGAIGIFFLSPSSGATGIQVRIQGFGFSPSLLGNQVAFNGTPATVLSATANAIVATVPSEATTGPVTVTNTNGTATSPQPFTVLTPTISGVDPSRVAQGITTVATIAGDNLKNATAVNFTQTGITATITGATAQSLQIRLTVAGSVPAGSYTFSVTTPLGTAQSGTVTVTVAPATPGFTTARVTVFVPPPAQVAPSGSSESAVLTGISVLVPYPAQVAPPGQTEGVARPTSVQMPIIPTVPATQAPPGQTEGVAPPTSVQMPIIPTVPTTQAPPGQTEGVAPPTSVQMP